MAASPTGSLTYQNFFSATLSADITDTATDIFLDTIPNGTEGFLVIEPDSSTKREVVYYTSKTALKVVCPSAADGRGQDDTSATTHSQGATVIMAPVAAYFESLQNKSALTVDAKGGWVTAITTSESWTYSSYDSTNKTGVITVPSDATTKYTAGMRVRFTNNSATQYGIITKVATTALTVYFGTDYSLTNAAITVPYYSVHKAPLGFPLDPAKWTVTMTSSVDRTTSSGTYTSLTDTATAPIGAWIMSGRLVLYSTTNGSTTYLGTVTWSTTTTTETHPDTTLRVIDRLDAASRAVGATLTFQTYINVTTATTFTLLGAASNSLNVYGSTYSPTKITFVCAYL